MSKFTMLKTSLVAGAMSLLITGTAHAESISAAVGGGGSCSTTGGSAADPFVGFLCLIYMWFVQGSLGVALALLSLFGGIVIGLFAGNKLGPAAGGLAVAVLIMIGPNMIAYAVKGATLLGCS